MLKNCIGIEIRKAFTNKFFLASVGILSALLIIDALLAIGEYIEFASYLKEMDYGVNPALASSTLYNSWIGGRTQGFIPILFYFVVPIAAALPCSWMYASESKSGYTRCAVTRVGKKRYFTAKVVAGICSGMAVVLIPIIINFILVAMAVPAYVPNIMWSIYYNVSEAAAFSEFFYTKPLIFAGIYIFIPAIFAGAWSCFCIAVSFFEKNIFVILFAPFIGMMFLVHIIERAIVFRHWVSVSPFEFLRGASQGVNSNGFIIGGWIASMLIVSLGVIFIRGCRDEIY